MFVNYVNGIVSINSYRKPNATITTITTITTIADLMQAVESLNTDENLVASVSSADLANPSVASFINTHADDSLDFPIEF